MKILSTVAILLWTVDRLGSLTLHFQFHFITVLQSCENASAIHPRCFGNVQLCTRGTCTDICVAHFECTAAFTHVLNRTNTTAAGAFFATTASWELSGLTDVITVLAMTLNCIHQVIFLLHPGANDLNCWSAVNHQLSLFSLSLSLLSLSIPTLSLLICAVSYQTLFHGAKFTKRLKIIITLWQK